CARDRPHWNDLYPALDVW
nr:immunoglobulin heavy chain junction region [Macaca mulatta]MOV55557.1 immunoglobulin heavy chain junction region [Macaca mulatta]MOV55933.1 immunoglobulin heavy chain junction region [Macaca mulatta]MOV57992.1 immunoglobulin heavy chain junction region [Macaca mulatta]MOV58336.1 immunoglobulin heavy chain junction region [Macaca mulatta]